MSDYHRQTMTPVGHVYVLPRCAVALYDDAGGGVLGTLRWRAQQVDNLRVTERFDEAEHWPTGVPHPVTHHFAERHELNCDALWNVSARLARNTGYILAVTWEDATLGADTQAYVRRFYQGVTTSSRELGSRDGNEFASGNVLKAQYYVETVGSGAPPDIGPGTETC